jgi:hypothetical protein
VVVTTSERQRFFDEIHAMRRRRFLLDARLKRARVQPSPEAAAPKIMKRGPHLGGLWASETRARIRG